MQAVTEYGEKWSKVAQHVPTRTDVQCRERFKNVLDPKLTPAPWTAGLAASVPLLMLSSKQALTGNMPTPR
jgi:hypothetical protein